MSNHLLALAETTKLARLLGVETERLDFLVDLPPAAIREFRDRSTDMLFDRDRAKLAMVAAAANLVPVAISAKIATRAFGPVLCAAVAALVEPRRAVDIAAALPAPFLAEAAIALDPRRTAAVIAQVPPRQVAAVATELLGRDEHVTMGRFVGVVPEPSLRAAAAVTDDADLLRIGFLMEDKGSINTLIDIVADRLPAIIRAAHTERLWAQGLDLLATVNDANKARLGDIVAGLGDEVLDGLVRAAYELDALSTLLPVTRAMSATALAALASRPAVHDEQFLAACVDVALREELWLDLLPLTGYLPPQPLAFVADRIAAEPEDRLDDLLRRAGAAGQWEAVIPLATALPDEDRRRLAALPVMTEPDDAASASRPASAGDGSASARDRLAEALRVD
ncbi:hypothetical protein [Nocardia cyriacigeorgica]|uniref:hypothetical protein n=1 Tax=Nocardia cyriacigeorgica TaxID=135487 RepID=UPI0018958AD5|nr:hypothetical protein [Nocardia cyriacigeorgica]MBF6434999.1 hypothetical protein [Nocardia cyriacigeorgica]MBF6454921.1 hypothetical protein [Nocardia cyriacigeorgica]MBF6480884.1 hypothetical protein [Nocardia cyriacigeorgica]MBF6552816.1 hypothetical protein [Nocardia cyriacigeorgica]